MTTEYIAHRYYGAPINDWGLLTDEICTDRDRCMDFVTESLKRTDGLYDKATPKNIRVLVLNHETGLFANATQPFCDLANHLLFD